MKLTDVFPQAPDRKLYLPVIHLPPMGAHHAAVREALTCVAAGADGALLISHNGISSVSLAEIWLYTTEALEKLDVSLPLGVNFLDLTDEPQDMISLAVKYGIQLVWSDSQTGEVGIRSEQSATGNRVLYMGGVAFKHQDKVPLAEIPKAVDRASRFMDVIVSSGDATGEEIDVGKAALIAECHPEIPKMVASGISVDNIDTLREYFSLFAVASSIAAGPHQIDVVKATKLGKKIHRA